MGSRRPMSRWLAGGLLLLVTLLFALYFLSTKIIVRVAFELASAQGFDLQELSLQRPGLDGIHIDTVTGDVGDVHIIADDIAVSYHLKGLLDQSLDAVDIGSLHVRVNAPQATSTPLATAANSEIDPAIIFGIVPRLRVQRLLLEIAQADFVGAGSLSLDGDNASFELAGVEPEFASNLSVSGSAQSNTSLHFAFFDRSEPDEPFLKLNAMPLDDETEVTGHFDLSGYPLSLVTGLLGLPEGSGRVQGQLASRLDSFDISQAYQLLPLAGSFQLDWQDETVEVEALRGQLSGSPASMVLTLAGGSIALSEAAVLFTVDSGTSVQYADNQISIGPGMTAILQDVEDITFQSRLTRTAIDMRNADISLDSDAEFTMTSYGLQTRGLITGVFLLPASGLVADLNITVGNLGFPLHVNYDSLSGRADMSGASQWSVKNLGASLVQKWPYDVDIVSGDVDVALQAVWLDGVLDGRAAVALDRGMVRYDEYELQQATAELDFVLDDSVLRLQPSTIRVGEFDFGLVVQNAEMKVAWQDDVVDIFSGKFDLLGGGVTIKPTQYDLGRNMASLDMDLVNMDLAQVLALEGDDIKGEGRLHGTLPVRINDGKVSMEGGQIRASDAGGLIQVSPKFTLGTGQPGIDFAMQALTNFNYQTLTAVADYEENGDLQLTVSLQGRNPEVEKGRPIHYNLNISENVFSLLDALNAQSGVTERVERGVMRQPKR